MNASLVFKLNNAAADTLESMLGFMVQIKKQKSVLEVLPANVDYSEYKIGNRHFNVGSNLCFNLKAFKLTDLRNVKIDNIGNIAKFVNHVDYSNICAENNLKNFLDVIFAIFAVKHNIEYKQVDKSEFDENNYTANHINWKLLDFLIESFTEIHVKGTLTY